MSERMNANDRPENQAPELSEGLIPPRPELSQEGTLELREEELVAHTELQELGEIVVRTEIEEAPGRLELEAYREEVEVEHVPMGQIVSERQEPWEEDGVLILPIYEEQLVVVKRLVMREQVRVRKIGLTETQLFEDKLHREKLVIDDPDQTGAVRERYSTEGPSAEEVPQEEEESAADQGGLVERVVRKVIS